MNVLRSLSRSIQGFTRAQPRRPAVAKMKTTTTVSSLRESRSRVRLGLLLAPAPGNGRGEGEGEGETVKALGVKREKVKGTKDTYGSK